MNEGGPIRSHGESDSRKATRRVRYRGKVDEGDAARELGRACKGEAALPSGNGHQHKGQEGPEGEVLRKEEVGGEAKPLCLTGSS
jgi:hypothetical protein